MTSKHTPGPWRVDPYGSLSEEVLTINNRYRILQTSRSPNVDREERRANARLIAAAPELLEALRMLCDTTSRYPGSAPTAILRDAETARALLTRIDGDVA